MVAAQPGTCTALLAPSSCVLLLQQKQLLQRAL
jgi:hypothetical protein